MTIDTPDSPENKGKVSIANPAYTKHEHADDREIEPENLHRGESNLSIDKEEQENINKVPEDNASNTLGDGVQHVAQDENGFKSAESDLDQPDNNSKQLGDDGNAAKSDNEDSNFGGDGVGRALTLGGYADDEEYVAY